jgi:hypothetical protein
LATQLQSGAGAGPLAVAPDGRQVAFVGRNATGGTLIWVRSLDTLDAKGLAGTEGGVSPFWSPNNRSLGFFADGKLKRIDVAGGPPVTLCDTMPGISGAWSPDGVIVFSEGLGTPLQKVSASGGCRLRPPFCRRASGTTRGRSFFQMAGISSFAQTSPPAREGLRL